MAVWQPPEEAAPAPAPQTQAEVIQSWIDGYTFIDNATTSQDILREVVATLPNHQYSYGPTEGGGYFLEITGDIVSQTFTVKAEA